MYSPIPSFTDHLVRRLRRPRPEEDKGPEERPHPLHRAQRLDAIRMVQEGLRGHRQREILPPPLLAALPGAQFNRNEYWPESWPENWPEMQN